MGHTKSQYHAAITARHDLARQRTPEERLELARELLTSVEPDQSPEWATAWKAELGNRWSAYESGADPGKSFDEEIDRARADLRATRR